MLFFRNIIKPSIQLFRIQNTLTETFEQVYDEHFSKQYGFFRPYVRKVIYRYPLPT
jgi:hypothetical protein